MNCPYCNHKIEILVKINGINKPEKATIITKDSCWCSITAYNGGLGKSCKNVSEFINGWMSRPKSQKYLSIFKENEAYFFNQILELINRKTI